MNDALPNTRLSLILRLPKPDQQQAWQEFVETYEPFLYRFMRRRGLEDAAARDVVQRVMMSVMKSIEHWVPVEGGPRFRSWLFTIARNHLINERKRQSHEIPVGGITALMEIEQGRGVELSASCDQADYRREVILFAASRVRNHLEPHTWQAFWRTAIEGETCQQVAQSLDLDVASVYAARSRVLRRIREQIELMWECEDER